MPDSGDVLGDLFGKPDPDGPNTDNVQSSGQDQVTGITLDVTDDDIADAENRATEFKPIPQYTWCNFEISDLEVKLSSGAKTAGAAQWVVYARELSGQWGRGKRVRVNIVFSTEHKFMWVPLIKALGLLGTGGKFTIPEREDVIGLRFRAQVLGHSWKNDLGDYKRSSGKKSDREVPPTDGRAMFEDIGNYTAYKPEDGDDDEPPSSEALNEFKPQTLFD